MFFPHRRLLWGQVDIGDLTENDEVCCLNYLPHPPTHPPLLQYTSMCIVEYIGWASGPSSSCRPPRPLATSLSSSPQVDITFLEGPLGMRLEDRGGIAGASVRCAPDVPAVPAVACCPTAHPRRRSRPLCVSHLWPVFFVLFFFSKYMHSCWLGFAPTPPTSSAAARPPPQVPVSVVTSLVPGGAAALAGVEVGAEVARASPSCAQLLTHTRTRICATPVAFYSPFTPVFFLSNLCMRVRLRASLSAPPLILGADPRPPTLGGQVGCTVVGINGERFLNHAHTVSTITHGKRPLKLRMRFPDA